MNTADRFMSWKETADYSETSARYYLARAQCLLSVANELEAIGRDGDAMLARENAYWLSQEATSFFNDARHARNRVET